MSTKNTSKKKDRTLVVALITVLGSILVAILTTYKDELAPIFFGVVTPASTIPLTVEVPALEQEKLQGIWGGKELGKDGEVKLIISGNHIEFEDAYTREWYKGILSLNQGVNEKQLDFIITEAPVPGFIGKTSHTIYKFEGDTLFFAVSEPGVETRPTDFEPLYGNRVFLFTLQP